MNISINKIIYIIPLALLFFSSCKKQGDESIPAYLKVDSSEVVVTPVQGTAFHNIVDVWAYDGNNLIGAFELPARFPILKSGNTEMNFYAGIKMNGIGNTRVPYPFYKVNTQTVNLVRDSIVEIPVLKYEYVKNAVFAFIEDFETLNNSLESSAVGNVKMERYELPELKELVPGENNKYAAGAVFSSDTSFLSWQTTTSFALPTNGKECFMELSYKNNNIFTVGIIGESSTGSRSHDILHINPSENWNKIYINLTATLGNFQEYKKFKIYFISKKINSLPDASVFIDNIKLIHLPI